MARVNVVVILAKGVVVVIRAAEDSILLMVLIVVVFVGVAVMIVWVMSVALRHMLSDMN